MVYCIVAMVCSIGCLTFSGNESVSQSNLTSWVSLTIHSDRETPMSQKVTQDADQQDKERDRKLKPEDHPRFKEFKKGRYVLLGTIKKYESAGSTPKAAGKQLHFHRITFKPSRQIRGDYFAAVERAHRNPAAKIDSKKQITALWTTEDEPIPDALKKPGEPCIVILEPIKASAMAGTVPVRIRLVERATDEMIKVAQAAADKK